MSPKPKPYLDDIATYVGGKTKAAGAARTIKLSSNENPYGASTKAIAAFDATDVALHRYPEDGCASLREAIAAKTGFAAEQIICGNGSDDVIRMVIHAYAGAGDEVLFPEHAFLMYRIYAQQYGATPVTAAETNYTTDVNALLAAVTERTRIVFVANPNNPTGSYIPRSEVERLRAGLRDDIILVIDGAYCEYIEEPDYCDGSAMVNSSNTVITRTFSKVFGLPALRIGWGYGPRAIIDTLYKVRSPFNVNQAAINAAIAALHDDEFLAQSVRDNAQQRERLSAALAAMGLHVYPSYGNFILIEFAQNGTHTASAANQFLLTRGIIPREVTNYGLPRCLRVTVGTPDENAVFLSSMEAFLAS